MSDEVPLKQAYLELAKAECAGDYDRALKACNRILRNYPNETRPFLCKLVCLIQMSKFEESLQWIRSSAHQLGACYFEKAYCEYRLNKTEKALETLANQPVSDRRCAELKAQLFYRLERYQEAESIYSVLVKDASDSYGQERRANFIASGVFLTDNSEMVNLDSPETYEQHFNTACRLIENKQFNRAIKQLKIAQNLCREMLLEDDVPEEEIEDELALIRTQFAYCIQVLGDREEALSIYLDVLKQQPSDLAVLAVVSNNVTSSRKDPNLFDARKKLKTAHRLADLKLTSAQKLILKTNQQLLQLYSTNKGSKQAKDPNRTKRRCSCKRKHKIRLPQNYDPLATPDPERWLPKQERSSYKKRKDRRFKDRDMGRGTQGVVEMDSKAKELVDSESPKPSPILSGQGPRQQRPAGQQNKKKKKKTAGKW